MKQLMKRYGSSVISVRINNAVLQLLDSKARFLGLTRSAMVESLAREALLNKDYEKKILIAEINKLIGTLNREYAEDWFIQKEVTGVENYEMARKIKKSIKSRDRTATKKARK